MSDSESFYIVKRPTETCEIVASPSMEPTDSDPQVLKIWGPFQTKEEAIARRVGLIRAGKCKPV